MSESELEKLSDQYNFDIEKVMIIIIKWILMDKSASMSKFKEALQGSGHDELAIIIEEEYSGMNLCMVANETLWDQPIILM